MSTPHHLTIGGEEAMRLARVAYQNDVKAISTTAQACLTSGCNIFAGGTGLTATLAKPRPGDRCTIILASIASGAVVVTAAAGSTFDGTNNTATFNAAADELVLVYKAEGVWQAVKNVSVSLSSV